MRYLEIREQESPNLNKAFSTVQSEQNNQNYYKAMHQDDYKILDDMEDPMACLSRSDPDTI